MYRLGSEEGSDVVGDAAHDPAGGLEHLAVRHPFNCVMVRTSILYLGGTYHAHQPSSSPSTLIGSPSTLWIENARVLCVVLN